MSGRSLRNMSVAPKTTITHHGVGAGTRLVVELPVTLVDPTPERVLELLHANPKGMRGVTAERELQRLIDAAIAKLLLPAAAPVRQTLDVPRDRVRYCTDLAEIVAILAKSSDRLFLRDKAPILSGVRSGRSVVLVLPDHLDWSN